MPSLVDGRITESSGLAYSRTHAGIGYTHNDEAGPIFVIEFATGQTVGTFSVKGASIKDPEAICVDQNGTLFYCDIGDDVAPRAVYMRGEPGPGDHGALDFTRYVLDLTANAESFIVHPVTNHRYVITKESPSRLLELPDNLVVNATNHLTDTGITFGNLVSDGAFTPDGRFLLLRRAGQNTTVFVHDGSTFASVGTITVPTLTKPEGITVTPDQMSFWISSEGVHSPLYNVALDAAYQPLPAGPPPPSPCDDLPPPPPDETPPADTAVSGLNLTNWKLTLPTGSKGSPLEIKQPQLATFRDDRFFYFEAGVGTHFKCPGNGVTTSGSTNPRCELREMTNNGASNASWSTGSGTHTLRIKQKVIAAPHDVVVGQVHDSANDITVARYETDGKLWATQGNTTHGTLLGTPGLNTIFEVTFVVGGGQLKTYYNGVLKQTLTQSLGGLYFKAGDYLQSHGSDAAVADVVITELEVTHS